MVKFYLPLSFNIRKFQNLTVNPLKVKPAVNQVELNYWNPQPELLKVGRIKTKMKSIIMTCLFVV